MTEHKVPCRDCFALILPTTAARTGGVCMACRNGIRDQIEASKLHYAEEREREKSDPWRIHWRGLIARIDFTTERLDGLSDPEQKYYAVTCLDNEIYNGGFHQYFWNSSGSNFGLAATALSELNASGSLELLLNAKEVLFGSLHVSQSTAVRRQYLHSLRGSGEQQLTDALERLDELYWKDPDGLGSRIQSYAVKMGLVKLA